ncbi:MAG TPA: RagB/SusD family nutrient uptake outer membrane protein [Longimicrobiaceae bacterium]|nr:RagB/SusD family nutrient uptake outer membrane protein [Longimicrobiaceae bacterium]
MRPYRILPALLLAAAAAGCADLELTNPNTRTTETFWRTQSDAVQGMNGVYNGLQLRGTYQRWLPFAYDIRSDIGQSPSPGPELNQFNKFTLGSYDFEVNLELYGHHYQAIFRANQAIANIPGVQMDAGLRDQLVGEAKFLRGLLYFNLANLYGSVPLILQPSSAGDRPASASNAELWTQIEKDFTEARAVLPVAPRMPGSATRGAATAMLGKAHLQQREWAQASQMFAEVVSSNRYTLLASYADLFRGDNDNSAEAIFEVQFGGPSVTSAGTGGFHIGQMIGPCGPSYCDARPTQWYFEEFQKEKTVGGQADPRLDATIFYNKAGGMDVFGIPFAQRYGNDLNALFWKKYTEYYLGRSDWNADINYKVVRLGGLLLNHAEALNEQNRPADALPFVNRVRQRAGLAPLAAGMSQAAMRAEIEHQETLELGLEGERWLYLRRHNLLGTPAVAAHDPTEFRFFVPGKSELLPIPTEETARNPNVTQNPGY